MQDQSQPSAKRRKIDRFPDLSDDTEDSQSSDDLDLPSHDPEDYIEIDEDILGNNASKYEAVMHQPEHVELQRNTFVSQVEQPWSSPTRIRGPRWRKQTPTPSPVQVPPEPPPGQSERNVANTHVGALAPPLIVDDFDDEDLAELVAAPILNVSVEEKLRSAKAVTRVGSANTMRQTTLFGMQAPSSADSQSGTNVRARAWPRTQRNEPPTHHAVNEDAMQTWTYPLNVGAIREYQYNIVHKSLFNNILVALPTGLGKTFIAATVMLNWYNWTKDAQIIFVAPTKPLVTQQIDAAFSIAGIPRSQTTLLTGEIPTGVRADEWQEKRVFFMTPQTLINDLKTGIADPKKIVLVVVDEAHKATGNYAYVEVVKFLRRFNTSFRVLGLTATPGASVDAVQRVIDGLGIARVEIRTEDSIDIQQYVHQRQTEVELFDYSDEINMCLELFSKSVKPVLDKLCSQNALWSKDPTHITLYGLMQARKQWMGSETGRKANPGLKAMIHHCFTPLMSLAHNLDLLKYHGIGPFFHKMKVFENEAYGGGKYAKSIVEHESFKILMNRVKSWVSKDDFIGHPKLEYLNRVVLNHFMDAGEGTGRAGGRPPSDTRIMVFAHFRDSAEEITRVLNRQQPMIRAHVFVGQSGTSGSEGMDQKKQIEIIQKFKAGTYNTLVATSIGEEGLDIGEVDLIVCYDCSKSPIRMLQRMGRTGRKRAGNIVLLLMRGKEERDYQRAKDDYLRIQHIIEGGKEFTFHTDVSPRIVPRHITPSVSKRYVEIPFENTQPGSVEPNKRKSAKAKKRAKKFHMPDGVETGFKFLGGGKKGKLSRAPDVLSLLDLEEAKTPSLESVTLSTAEVEDLRVRYAQVSGSTPQVIEVVQVGRQPRKIKQPDRTHFVGHSQATRRVITASKNMHTKEKCWDRPLIQPRINKSCPRKRLTGTSSPAPSDSDCELKSAEQQLGAFKDTLLRREVDVTTFPNGRDEPAKEVTAALLSDSDGELPEINSLFTKTRSPDKTFASVQMQQRRGRRVISDDDSQ